VEISDFMEKMRFREVMSGSDLIKMEILLVEHILLGYCVLMENFRYEQQDLDF
jgi:hypothetical protein